jgi:sec-independent protein translocase protein TatA
MPFGVSIWELLILLVVLLLVFGPNRLPGIGRSLGKGMREFKDAVSGEEETTPTPTSPPSASPPELPAADSDESIVSQPAQRAPAQESERETVA